MEFAIVMAFLLGVVCATVAWGVFIYWAAEFKLRQQQVEEARFKQSRDFPDRPDFFGEDR